jgi:hypothetical protein
MVLPLNGGHKDKVKLYKKFPLFGGAGAMSGKGKIYRHTFKGFTNTTSSCGSKQRAIMPALNPDYTPFTEFFSPRFIDQAMGAMSFIANPP